jgi:hypothetical protein
MENLNKGMESLESNMKELKEKVEKSDKRIDGFATTIGFAIHENKEGDKLREARLSKFLLGTDYQKLVKENQLETIRTINL